MLSSRKPLQLILSTLALAGIATAAPGEEACCAGGKSGCEVDCSEAIAHVTALFERVVTPSASCSAEAKAASSCSAEAKAASSCGAEAKAASSCGAETKVAAKCEAGVEGAAAKVAKAKYQAVAPWQELSKILASRPEAWKIVKPLIAAKFASEASEAVRNNAISLLAWQYSEPAVTIASEIADEYPSVKFSQDQVIAFAEAGSKRFWGMAADMQKTQHEVMPTALMAIHGKCADSASVRKDLLERIARPAVAGDEAERFVASLALNKLGEPQHLDAARASLRDSVLAALDQDDIALAGRLALTAGFLDEACSSYAQPRISFLDVRLKEFCSKRAEDVGSADKIFALVERLFAL